ncbi:hypothetical protein ACFLZV_07400 [Candidatus Margulisiibacteriota bacterium]
MTAQALSSKIYKSLAELNCKINELSIPELFSKYEQYGFLYQEKKVLLQPFLETIEKNWAQTAKADLMRVVTRSDEQTQSWASFSSWRSCNSGYINQHLVFSENHDFIKSVLLGAHAKDLVGKDDYSSFQHFFVASHAWPNKVFGSLTGDLLENTFDLRWVNFIRINPELIKPSSFPVEIRSCSHKEHRELYHFVAQQRGEVFAKAEELHRSDLYLDKLDHLYQSVGLKMHRTIKIAYLPQSREPIAVIIAYQGPLGLSFNFLENRCILIVDQSLSNNEKYGIACAMLKEISSFYQDFAPGHIPLLVDDYCAQTLVLHGHPLDRRFKHLICLRGGFDNWVQHIERVFQRD